ncbi:MAG TPA: 4Fe-4S binding protein [Methanoregula sp.]|nr:4Fe-4S binding protein [Methanoregula sp.]
MTSAAPGPVGREWLETFFREHRADEFVVVPVSAIHAPPGRGPADLLPACRSVIIFGRVMGDELFCGTQRETSPAIRAFKQDLARTSGELARALEEQGAAAMAVSSVYVKDGKVRGSLSLKHCARDAGLGEIGCNTLLISPRFGNRLGLGAVLASGEIGPVPAPAFPHGLCTRCGACIRSCPERALGPDGIKQARCRNMTGAVPAPLVPVLFRLMQSERLEVLSSAIANQFAKRSGSRCSACLIACPYFNKGGA